MTVDEVAERLGVHRQSVFRWVRKGHMRARHVPVEGCQWYRYEIHDGELMDFDRDWPGPNRKRTKPTALNRL